VAASKAPDAFRTIGELADELGVAQHILRYWESKFSQLRPLQRAGNRRYYRPADVDLARRIHRLLNQEGYTIRGVQKLLADGQAPDAPASAFVAPSIPVPPPAHEPESPSVSAADLRAVRDRLTHALDD
jgi:DNA-binding transcriptional MerR regulator